MPNMALSEQANEKVRLILRGDGRLKLFKIAPNVIYEELSMRMQCAR